MSTTPTAPASTPATDVQEQDVETLAQRLHDAKLGVADLLAVGEVDVLPVDPPGALIQVEPVAVAVCC